MAALRIPHPNADLAGAELAAWASSLEDETVNRLNETPIPQPAMFLLERAKNPTQTASLTLLLARLESEDRAALDLFTSPIGTVALGRADRRWRDINRIIVSITDECKKLVLGTLNGIDFLPLRLDSDLRFLLEPRLAAPRPLLSVWREFAAAATPAPLDRLPAVEATADAVCQVADALTERYEARRQINTLRDRQAGAVLSVLLLMIPHPALAYEQRERLNNLPADIPAAVRTLADAVLALVEADAPQDGAAWCEAFKTWFQEAGIVFSSRPVTEVLDPSRSRDDARAHMAREWDLLESAAGQLQEAEKSVTGSVAAFYRFR